jgi:hypothetical protein
MLDQATQVTMDDLRAAVARWRPDPTCIDAGNDALDVALRCWAAGGLTDQQSADRLRDTALPFSCAAIVLARHCAFMDLPVRQIIAILAYLHAHVPCWPDADAIATIAENAVAECRQ